MAEKFPPQSTYCSLLDKSEVNGDVKKHFRLSSDLNDDGRVHTVGLANAAFEVALDMSNGTFSTPRRVLSTFG